MLGDYNYHPQAEDAATGAPSRMRGDGCFPAREAWKKKWRGAAEPRPDEASAPNARTGPLQFLDFRPVACEPQTTACRIRPYSCCAYTPTASVMPRSTRKIRGYDKPRTIVPSWVDAGL